jgi:hypothetical protein
MHTMATEVIESFKFSLIEMISQVLSMQHNLYGSRYTNRAVPVPKYNPFEITILLNKYLWKDLSFFPIVKLWDLFLSVG